MHEQRTVIAEHYRLAEDLYGPEHCGRQMRKFGIKYSQLHPNGREVRDAFVAVTRPGEWQACWSGGTRSTRRAAIPSGAEELQECG